jgi:betaine lipid synthase
MIRLCAGQLLCDFPNQFVQYNNNKPKTEVAAIKTTACEAVYITTDCSCKNSNKRRLAWVDIGCGTGFNIEKMNENFPISNFDKIYCVDIAPTMCKFAENRFAKLGWRNVVVVCSSAENFCISESDLHVEGQKDLEIVLATFSYSLTMMQNIYPVVDHIMSLLSPDGFVGVADFYVSAKHSSADATRQISWLKRWFWSIWFDFDGLYLQPSVREYLEHKFANIKMVSHLKPFIPHLVYIPYYVWLGAQNDKLEHTASELQTTCNNLGNSFVKKFVPRIKFACKHSLHGKGMKWRVPYDTNLNTRFDTYIYAFTWEDPREDIKHLSLTKDDIMFVMTSEGCNVLEYVLHDVKRIHAVDMNPCQGHMLELKLAALSSLSYEQYWQLFGQGYLPNFSHILETKMAPFMSPYAYQFWHRNKNFRNLYLTGCTGIAIKVIQFVVKLCRLTSTVRKMCHAKTLEEQGK